MRGDSTCVPHELPTANHHTLFGHVSEAELKPNVPQVNEIEARAEDGDDGGQSTVHVEAGGASSSDRQSVEVKRINSESHSTGQ